MGFDLEEALRRYPLPAGQPDETVNRGQCATALGVSEPMITRYLDQGLPVLERGGNGQAYEFRLSEVFAWKMWRDAESQAVRQRADNAAQQMALLFLNDQDGPAQNAMSPKEIREWSEAEMIRNRAAEQRGELVRRNRVEALFEEVLAEFRQQIVTLVDFAEMEFALTAPQVDKLQRRCDSTLEQARIQLGHVCPIGGTQGADAVVTIGAGA